MILCSFSQVRKLHVRSGRFVTLTKASVAKIFLLAHFSCLVYPACKPVHTSTGILHTAMIYWIQCINSSDADCVVSIAHTHTVRLHSRGIPCTLQYTTVQYTTVHYSTLQYNTVQYSTLQYTTVHYSTLHSTIQYNTVHYSTLQYTTLHYTTVHYSTLHYSTLQYTTVHYTIVRLQRLH